MNVKPLLDFIAKPESGGDYNIVWGGIAKKDRPPKPLTTMTISEVLAWQDSIDARYQSEAAGRYQIMEDTLRGPDQRRALWNEAGLTLSTVFSEGTQDKLATQLLKRRGLMEYLDGKIDAVQFANNLAKEWASLPVVSGPKKGRSHYAGDGLNKAHVSVDAFLAAVKSVAALPKGERNAPDRSQKPETDNAPGFWASLFTALMGILRGKP